MCSYIQILAHNPIQSLKISIYIAPPNEPDTKDFADPCRTGTWNQVGSGGLGRGLLVDDRAVGLSKKRIQNTPKTSHYISPIQLFRKSSFSNFRYSFESAFSAYFYGPPLAGLKFWSFSVTDILSVLHYDQCSRYADFEEDSWRTINGKMLSASVVHENVSVALCLIMIPDCSAWSRVVSHVSHAWRR